MPLVSPLQLQAGAACGSPVPSPPAPEGSDCSPGAPGLSDSCPRCLFLPPFPLTPTCAQHPACQLLLTPHSSPPETVVNGAPPTPCSHWLSPSSTPTAWGRHTAETSLSWGTPWFRRGLGRGQRGTRGRWQGSLACTHHRPRLSSSAAVGVGATPSQGGARDFVTVGVSGRRCQKVALPDVCQWVRRSGWVTAGHVHGSVHRARGSTALGPVTPGWAGVSTAATWSSALLGREPVSKLNK